MTGIIYYWTYLLALSRPREARKYFVVHGDAVEYPAGTMSISKINVTSHRHAKEVNWCQG